MSCRGPHVAMRRWLRRSTHYHPVVGGYSSMPGKALGSREQGELPDAGVS